MQWLPVFLELLGTIVYMYVRMTTKNPLVIGTTLAALIFLIQNHHSGSFNPALDITHVFAGNTNRWTVIKHLSAQLGGALIAGLLYRWAQN